MNISILPYADVVILKHLLNRFVVTGQIKLPILAILSCRLSIQNSQASGLIQDQPQFANLEGMRTVVSFELLVVTANRPNNLADVGNLIWPVTDDHLTVFSSVHQFITLETIKGCAIYTLFYNTVNRVTSFR